MTMNYPLKKAGRPLIQALMPLVALRKPTLLIGDRGIGKSVILSQVASELSIEYRMIDLSTMDPTDLQGVPKISGETLRYFRTDLLPTRGSGLLCLEELNRCPTYMRQPVLNLLTARRLNDYLLPDGWSVAASINPSEDGYEVDEMCPALLSRFAVFRVVADRREWLAWARTAGIHSDVCHYIESDRDVFSQPDSNPRAWHNVSDVVHSSDADPVAKTILRDLIASYLGTTRASAFLSFLSAPENAISAEEILNDYSRHRARVVAWTDSGNLDYLHTTLSHLLCFLQPKANVKRVMNNQKKRKNLTRFLGDLPGDLLEQAEQHLKSHGHPVPRVSKP